MRRFIWATVTLALMLASFGVGRLSGGGHSVPAMVATLPGDEAGFSNEFDARIHARFPIGSNEDELVAYLAGEKFAPDWRRRDDANASALVLSGLICTKIIRVTWRANSAGALTAVNGAYESRCL